MNRFGALAVTLAFAAGLTAFGSTAPGRAAQEAAAPTTTLVDVVRQATQPFQSVENATSAGYAPMLGCVSGPQEGAMGIHYMNVDLIGDGEVNAEQPEALLYEMHDGELRFLGVEYLVLADAWSANHEAPPSLMGQLFNYVASPNRYGNPPFYELHVWVGKDNPRGMFADWNPTVTCDDFVAAATS